MNSSTTPDTTPRRLPPPRRRLRPLWYLLGALLIICGSLGAYWSSQKGQVRYPVLAAATTIPAGATIERNHIRIVALADTTGLATIAGKDLTNIVGKQASTNIPAGTLLATEALRPTSFTKGESIVGLALTPAQRPSIALAPGDNVSLIATPAEQGEVPTTPPPAIAGIVVSTTDITDTADMVVNIRIDQAQATQAAALAATRRIALVLNPEVS